MDTLKAPDPADLRPGTECQETATVSVDMEDVTALLICGLAGDHGGALHFDPVDRVWWAHAPGAVA
jgi:hypothetical protein